jgi:hypothetical protein
LYADFYAASGFQVDRVWLCEIPIDLPRGVWKVYDYLGSSERFVSLGQLSGKIWFTFSVATAKSRDKETNALVIEPRTPQQWVYTQTWARAADDAPTAGPGIVQQDTSTNFEAGSRSHRITKKFDRLPRLQKMLAKSIRSYRNWVHRSQIRRGKLPYPFLGEF